MVLRIDDNVRTAVLFLLLGAAILVFGKILGWALDVYTLSQLPADLAPLAEHRNGYIWPSGILLTNATSSLSERAALAFVCACGCGLIAALAGALVSRKKARGARIMGRWSLIGSFALLLTSAVLWAPASTVLDPNSGNITTLSRKPLIGDLCLPALGVPEIQHSVNELVISGLGLDTEQKEAYILGKDGTRVLHFTGPDALKDVERTIAILRAIPRE